MTKYGAIPTEVDGIRFASRGEAARYKELCLLERGGAITNLRLQPRYPLVVNGVKIGTYVGDFLYDEGGTEVLEDHKGMLTPMYRMKKKLVKALYGIEIRENRG